MNREWFFGIVATVIGGMLVAGLIATYTLVSDIANLSTSLAGLTTNVTSLSLHIEKTLDDHEVRIRSVERQTILSQTPSAPLVGPPAVRQ